MCAMGVMMAIIERSMSGVGQIVFADMVSLLDRLSRPQARALIECI